MGLTSPWPDDHVALLRKLWSGDRSASLIARALNEAFDVRYTREAVSGKLARLGLRRGRRSALSLDTASFRNQFGVFSKRSRVKRPVGRPRRNGVGWASGHETSEPPRVIPPKPGRIMALCSWWKLG